MTSNINNILSQEHTLEQNVDRLSFYLNKITVFEQGEYEQIEKKVIDHNDDSVKMFYKQLPSLLEQLFSSNHGIIDKLNRETNVTFNAYNNLLQHFSPNYNSSGLIEFILSSSANNSTYKILDIGDSNMRISDCSNIFYKLKDISYLSSNLKILRDLNENEIVEKYIFTAFPRMMVKKSNSINNSNQILKNTSDIKQKQSLNNINNSKNYNYLNELDLTPYELLVINLLYFIKKNYSNIKVKALHLENKNFSFLTKDNRDIRDEDLNTKLNKMNIDPQKSLIANFLIRVFQNLVEYLCAETTIEEYNASNYSHKNSLLSFNYFCDINNKLKRERLDFLCLMVDVIWCSDYYMKKLYKNSALMLYTDLSNCNLIIINCLEHLLKTLQITNMFFYNNSSNTNNNNNTNNLNILSSNSKSSVSNFSTIESNNLVFYNKDNLITKHLIIPLFYLLDTCLDFFNGNINLINMSSISFIDVLKLYKTYTLPWKSYADFYNLFENNWKIQYNIFVYSNIQFFTYLFNKLIMTISSINNIEIDLMLTLNEIIHPYKYNNNDYLILVKSVSLPFLVDLSLSKASQIISSALKTDRKVSLSDILHLYYYK